MKKSTTLISCILFSLFCNAQNKNINSFLNGIWKMECCDPDFWIYYNNKIYWINKTNYNDNLYPSQYYCFPMKPSFVESPITFKKTFTKIYSDSVFLDKKFNLINGSEIIEVLTYKKIDSSLPNEIPNNGSVFYQIDPSNNDIFFSWYHSNSQRIVTYNRVLNPPEYALNFYKKVAKDRFKKIKYLKSNIYKTPNHPSKMYLTKFDEVEIIEKTEQNQWYKIRFYGKTTIEGWIRQTDTM